MVCLHASVVLGSLNVTGLVSVAGAGISSVISSPRCGARRAEVQLRLLLAARWTCRQRLLLGVKTMNGSECLEN